MAETITETILGGVVTVPRNSPKKLTIEFDSGIQLTAEGDALRIWWIEQLQMYNVFTKLTNGPPPVSSEIFQNMFAEKEVENKTEDS